MRRFLLDLGADTGQTTTNRHNNESLRLSMCREGPIIVGANNERSRLVGRSGLVLETGANLRDLEAKSQTPVDGSHIDSTATVTFDPQARGHSGQCND